VQASLRHLLARAIDYAGLFPPASLESETAIREYREWKSHTFNYSLGRFCCPVARLEELVPFLDAGERIEIAAIGRASDSRQEWDRDREREARLLTDFETRAGGMAEVTAFEVRLPETRDPAVFFDDLEGFAAADVFAELPWNGLLSDTVAAAAERDWLALKARTGGVHTGDVPSADLVAGFIWNCMSLEVPFKFTAGLHHALPNVNSESGDRQHGFLNVLTASVLAFAEEVPAKELTHILTVVEPNCWTFDENQMRFKGHVVATADIEAAREVFTGFGSCSIQEPYEGLMRLGFVERTVPRGRGSNSQ
jgi:hypothetical protein